MKISRINVDALSGMLQGDEIRFSNLVDELKRQGDVMARIARQVNIALGEIERHQNGLEKVGAEKPGAVRSLAVEGRQGYFDVTWEKQVGIDGYYLYMATDSAMAERVGFWNIPHSEAVRWQAPIGNVAATRHFQIFSYVGSQISDASEIVSDASIAFTTAEAEPNDPPHNPAPPSRFESQRLTGEVL